MYKNLCQHYVQKIQWLVNCLATTRSEYVQTVQYFPMRIKIHLYTSIEPFFRPQNINHFKLRKGCDTSLMSIIMICN